MTLKELLPKKMIPEMVMGHKVDAMEVARAYNAAIDDCLSALEGKVVAVEELLGVVEIERALDKVYLHPLNFKFAQTIHAEQGKKISK